MPLYPPASDGGAAALVDLTDVDLTGIDDGDPMVWDAGTSKVVPGTPGPTTLAALADVSAGGAASDDALVFVPGVYTVGEADTGPAPTITALAYTAGAVASVWPGDATTVRLWNYGVAGGNYLTYDFGEGNARRYARVDITQFTHYSGQIRVVCSNDGVNWTQVAWFTPSGFSSVIEFDDKSRLARYWRVLSLYGSGDAPGFGETKFYHSVVGDDAWGASAVAVPENLADLADVDTGGVAPGNPIVFESGSPALGGLIGEDIVDDDVSTAASGLILGSGAATMYKNYGSIRMGAGAWVRYDFGSVPRRFFKWEFDLGEPTKYATQIVIEHSDDASVWTEAANVSGLAYAPPLVVELDDKVSVKRYWRFRAPVFVSTYAAFSEVRFYQAVSTDGWAVAAVDVPTLAADVASLEASVVDLRAGSIAVVFDAPEADDELDIVVPFDCTITKASLLGAAATTGSIVIDIWKDTYANFPPTDADSITAAAPPTITTAVKSEDATLTDWTVALAAGDVLRFHVDSVTDITRVTLVLDITRT